MDNYRTFYIFKINKLFTTIYDNKDYNLFMFFNEINKSKKLSIKDKYKIYKKIVRRFNKNSINKLIYKNHINNVKKKKSNNMHCIINKYENSRIYINNSFIKLITNKNISSFSKDIREIDKDLFIIDFNNNDFFFIKNIKIK